MPRKKSKSSVKMKTQKKLRRKSEMMSENSEDTFSEEIRRKISTRSENNLVRGRSQDMDLLTRPLQALPHTKSYYKKRIKPIDKIFFDKNSLKIFTGEESDYHSLDLDNIDGDYEDIDSEAEKLERDFLEENKRIIERANEIPIENSKYESKKRNEFYLNSLVSDVIQTSKTNILYSKIKNFENVKTKITSCPTCCYWNTNTKKLYYGTSTGEICSINLVKGSQKVIEKGNYESKPIKGIYCSDEETLVYCNYKNLFRKLPSSNCNSYYIEKVQSQQNYYDSTQFIFHRQSFDSDSASDIIYLNYCCSFYQIDVNKLSNEDDSFLKSSHEILPKPNEIFDRVMDFDDDNILNSDVLDALFEETSVRLINFKASRGEIVCLTDQDSSRAVYIYSLELKIVVQKINYRNPRLLEFYQLRTVAVSRESRFMILSGWTSKGKDLDKYPFVSFYVKREDHTYSLTGTSVLFGMKGTITTLEFMPKRQDDYIFFMAFDSEGNFSVHRTNGIQFDQVFFKEKYHNGIVNCMDFNKKMRLISCSTDHTIKSSCLYPN